MSESSPKPINPFEFSLNRVQDAPSLPGLDVEKFIEKVEAVKRRPVLAERGAARIRDYLKGSSEVPEFHDAVITRVTTEVPGLIEDFEELGIDSDLFDEDLSGKKHGVEINWESPLAKERCAGASYFPHSRKIEFSYPQPDFLDRILSVAVTGRMHTSLLAYGHEFAHDLQYRIFPAFDSNARPVVPQIPTDLKEAQAYLISDPHLSVRQLGDLIINSKGKDGDEFYPGIEPQKLRSNLKLFKLLNALDIPQPEITRLVRNPGQWEDAKYSYTNISQKVKDSARRVGLTPGEIELRSDLLYEWDQARAKNIVFQELKRLVGERVVKSS